MMARLLAEIRIDQEEITARLEAKIDANQEKMDAKTDANLKEMKAEIRANNEEFEVLRSTLVSRMAIHQVRTEAVQEVAKMDARQERMGASMNVWRKEITACQDATEACLEGKEPTSLETVHSGA
jgi:multidrug resistance efflux pump